MAFEQYTFQVYAPLGALLGDLPDLEDYSVTFRLSDHGTLRFSYPKQGRNSNLITPGKDFEIAMVHLPVALPSLAPVEGYGCRFIPISVKHNPFDEYGMVEYEMATYSWLARKTVVGGASTAAGFDVTYATGTWNYSTMLTDLFVTRPAARSAGKSITPSMTGISLGTAVKVNGAATLDQVISDLTSTRGLLWITNARGIYFELDDITPPFSSNVGSLNYDQSTTFTILPHWITDAEVTTDWSRQVTHVQNGTITPNSSYSSSPSLATTAWGNAETGAIVENTSMWGASTKDQLSEFKILEHKYSVDIALMQKLPVRDFKVGDHITIPVVTGDDPYAFDFARSRIVEMAITCTAGRLRLDLVMGSRVTDQANAMLRRYAGWLSKNIRVY